MLGDRSVRRCRAVTVWTLSAEQNTGVSRWREHRVQRGDYERDGHVFVLRRGADRRRGLVAGDAAATIVGAQSCAVLAAVVDRLAHHWASHQGSRAGRKAREADEGYQKKYAETP